jgi:hypothetical protein
MNPSTQTHARNYLTEQVSLYLESQGFEVTSTLIPRSGTGVKIIAEKQFGSKMIRVVLEILYDYHRKLLTLHTFNVQVITLGKVRLDLSYPTVYTLNLFRNLSDSPHIFINRPLDIIEILERYNDQVHKRRQGELPLWYDNKPVI